MITWKKYYVNTKNLYENILISLKDNVKFFRWEKNIIIIC